MVENSNNNGNLSNLKNNFESIISTEEIEVVDSETSPADSITESGSIAGVPHEDLIRDFGYCREAPEILASHQHLPLYNTIGKKTPIVDFIMSQLNLDFMIQDIAKKHIDDVENNPFRNSTVGEYLSDIQSAVDIISGVESTYNASQILTNNLDIVTTDSAGGSDGRIQELWDAIGFNLPFSDQSSAAIFYSFCSALEEDLLSFFNYQSADVEVIGETWTSDGDDEGFTPQQEEKLDELGDKKLDGGYDFGGASDGPADSGAGSGQGGGGQGGGNSTTGTTQTDGTGGSSDDGNGGVGVTI